MFVEWPRDTREPLGFTRRSLPFFIPAHKASRTRTRRGHLSQPLRLPTSPIASEARSARKRCTGARQMKEHGGRHPQQLGLTCHASLFQNHASSPRASWKTFYGCIWIYCAVRLYWGPPAFFLNPFQAVDSHPAHVDFSPKRLPSLGIVMRLHTTSARKRLARGVRLGRRLN